MIKFLFHLLFQLLKDFRQTLTTFKFTADCQIKTVSVFSFHKIIKMICHQLIIAIYILKEQQRLSCIQIQIKAYSSQLFLNFLFQSLFSRIKKGNIGFKQDSTMPAIPFVQIDHIFCFFQHFYLAGVKIILQKILLQKIFLFDLTTFFFLSALNFFF